MLFSTLSKKVKNCFSVLLFYNKIYVKCICTYSLKTSSLSVVLIIFCFLAYTYIFSTVFCLCKNYFLCLEQWRTHNRTSLLVAMTCIINFRKKLERAKIGKVYYTLRRFSGFRINFFEFSHFCIIFTVLALVAIILQPR